MKNKLNSNFNLENIEKFGFYKPQVKKINTKYITVCPPKDLKICSQCCRFKNKTCIYIYKWLLEEVKKYESNSQ